MKYQCFIHSLVKFIIIFVIDDYLDNGTIVLLIFQEKRRYQYINNQRCHSRGGESTSAERDGKIYEY